MKSETTFLRLFQTDSASGRRKTWVEERRRQKVNVVWWLAELATILFLLQHCNGFYFRSQNTLEFAELYSW